MIAAVPTARCENVRKWKCSCEMEADQLHFKVRPSESTGKRNSDLTLATTEVSAFTFPLTSPRSWELHGLWLIHCYFVISAEYEENRILWKARSRISIRCHETIHIGNFCMNGNCFLSSNEMDLVYLLQQKFVDFENAINRFSDDYDDYFRCSPHT